MWIKICGTTTLEDARLAIDCGADALGFVFAPSPRRLNEEDARRIIELLPAGIETFGVFVDASFDRIVAAVASCGLSGVQLHQAPERGLPGRLKDHFVERGRKLSVVEVLSLPEGASVQTQEEMLSRYADGPALDAVLVDSSTAKRVGGTGTRFDWQAAQPELARISARMRMIVAGGLNAENVAEAITVLRPWGVDVVSGVESAPGRKDVRRLSAFIEAARRAAREQEDVSPQKTAVTAQ